MIYTKGLYSPRRYTRRNNIRRNFANKSPRNNIWWRNFANKSPRRLYYTKFLGSGREDKPTVPRYKQKRLEREKQKFREFESEIRDLTNEVMEKAQEIDPKDPYIVFKKLMTNHVFQKRKSWLNDPEHPTKHGSKYMDEDSEYVVISDPLEEGPNSFDLTLVSIKDLLSGDITKMLLSSFISSYENVRDPMKFERDTPRQMLKAQEDYHREEEWEREKKEIERRFLEATNISSQLEG